MNYDETREINLLGHSVCRFIFFLLRRSFFFEVRAEENEQHGTFIEGRPIVFESRTDLGYCDDCASQLHDVYVASDVWVGCRPGCGVFVFGDLVLVCVFWF